MKGYQKETNVSLIKLHTGDQQGELRLLMSYNRGTLYCYHQLRSITVHMLKQS